MKGIPPVTVIGLLWSTAVTALPRHGQVIRDNIGGVVFDCPIPRHDSKLPLFSLGSQAHFPSGSLDDILKSAAPGVTLTEKNEDGNRYFYDGDLLVGYFDSTTGETSVFPKLGS